MKHKNIHGRVSDLRVPYKMDRNELSKKLRCRKKYRDWVKAVMEKDNNVCNICGMFGECLQVHHKISLKKILDKNDFKNIEEALNSKELFELNNGETLCSSCHQELHEQGRLFN